VAVSTSSSGLAAESSAVFPSSPHVTGTVTWSAGELVILYVVGTESVDIPTVTIGGNATTKIGQALRTNSGSAWTVAAFYFMPGSGGSGTASITNDAIELRYCVRRYTGHDTSTPIVASSQSSTTGASGVDNLTTNQPDMADTTNNLRVALAGVGRAGPSSATVTSPWGETVDYVSAPFFNGMLYLAEGRTNTDVNIDLNATGDNGYGVFGFEIAAGSSAVTSTGAATAPAPVAAATGLVGMTGTAAATAPAPIAAATGVETIPSTAAATVPAPVAAATGVNALTSTGAAQLPAPTALASVVETITSSSAAQFPTLTALATGVETITGTGAATLGATAAATGVVNLPANTQLVVGDGTSFVGYALVGPSVASTEITSTAAASLTAPVALAAAVETLTSSAAASLPAPVALAAGVETVTSTAAATAPAPVGDAIGTIGSGDISGTATATLTAPVAAATGLVGDIITSTAAASLTAPVASAVGVETVTSTGAGVVPFPVALAAILNVNNAIRISGPVSVSIPGGISVGGVTTSAPGGILVGKVSTD
jgi:hypothetical protein